MSVSEAGVLKLRFCGYRHCKLFAAWHKQQPLHPGGGVQLSGLFFSAQHFCIFSGEKITDWVFLMTCCSHMGRFELVYRSLRTLSLRVFPTLSGRSCAVGHRPPGRCDVAVGLICVFLSWDGNCWHCWLSGWLCLFLAEVLQVMPVDISGPNSPAMLYLAQLMPAECKPW